MGRSLLGTSPKISFSKSSASRSLHLTITNGALARGELKWSKRPKRRFPQPGSPTSNSGKAPDAIYVGMVVDNNAAQLMKDKVAIMGDNTKVKYVGPDGIQTQAFIDGAGKDVAEGVYASVAGVPLDKLPPAGLKFVTDYEAKYGKLTEPYAVYGYETMNVALKAIEDVCAAGGNPTDRAVINKAVFAIKDFDGALGTWSFDANGDTSLTDMTFYQVKDGAYVSVGTYK